MRNLGLGFDFSTPYYIKPISSMRAKYSFSVRKMLQNLTISGFAGPSVKSIFKISKNVIDAFRIVLSSQVV